MQRFESKIALVTGAAQGIGLAIARQLAHEGATLVLWDIHAPGLSQQAMRLAEAGHVVHPTVVDVGSQASVHQALDEALTHFSRIDILVNAAGILHTGSLLDMSPQAWEDTFKVNTLGVFQVSTAVAKQMRSQQSGCIVTVGSNAAATPRLQMGAYAASKAASAQFTKCLGLELAPHGVRCNVVSPGSTDTPMQRALWDSADSADRVIAGDLSQHRLGIPLQRIADADDIAQAVCFLASDSARHITMHDLRVDGGATLDAR
ncbi:2,3-dihydro-2,3-dihydroxybenzoate dehydrogenase [Aquabacterium sp.]|uniref:2,3-dihydro-2,3-dihydroxybenzoate dehydrogenase n=1 Tax=Aquabacterium sp. TaxID=1872578 RepID=UPI0024896969|nr:2,3-dihydro-2,3-dihydroxybenzoate dehydrogenase [Aquabacterium sp.]MDI1261537.1 2,3-dihydro-2,3-dihydroxybenzoate dehydrogenase [Aquabacterium sp.]